MAKSVLHVQAFTSVETMRGHSTEVKDVQTRASGDSDGTLSWQLRGH